MLFFCGNLRNISSWIGILSPLLTATSCAALPNGSGPGGLQPSSVQSHPGSPRLTFCWSALKLWIPSFLLFVLWFIDGDIFVSICFLHICIDPSMFTRSIHAVCCSCPWFLQGFLRNVKPCQTTKTLEDLDVLIKWQHALTQTSLT